MVSSSQKVSQSPLLNRKLSDPIAFVGRPLSCIAGQTGVISAGDFLHHVHRLAEQLPEGRHCINLCDNRYLFMVGLCAVIVAKQTNLLPANKNSLTQQHLAKEYLESYVLHDGLIDVAADLVELNLSELLLVGSRMQASEPMPVIDFDHLAVISFTSGSTGQPQANLKFWKTLLISTQINSRYMLPNLDHTFYHLATMPSQHMWGFETTVLMAMLAKVCIADSRPLYPQDICRELDKLPAPRALVSTPLHLRALQASDTKAPQLDYILSATAPLDQNLAQAVEAKLSTKLSEVYGCSEVGSMAIRTPASAEQWQRFDGLEFIELDEGAIVVKAAHLPVDVHLQDKIKLLIGPFFELQGRSSDLVNIAGKRGSLHAVNKVLQSYPGLIDGVVIFPPQTRNVPRLIGLVVLSEGDAIENLKQHFKQHLDAAFVPRPLYLVDALPREQNGKLVKARLLEFYQALSKRSVK